MIAIRQLDKPASASPALTTSHALLTDAWTKDVSALQAALGRIEKGGGLSGDCRVTFFEVAGDAQLHVEVAHRAAAGNMNGSSGAGSISERVVHNRAFSRLPRYQVLREIREMVFARRP
jgi:hypothetical protein